MSYKNLLTHRCDVYHLKERYSNGGDFGVPTDDVEKDFYYDDSPDLVDVPCYFTEKNQSLVQLQPNQTVYQTMMVHFLPSADIRLNTKLVWEGVTCKLQKPRKIKNHHIEVIAIRDDQL
ncbi:DUF3599 family protein [Heyndrickxia oleronia]|uniref:DUF3599 family protein n=1 Tax=Heyndrickxia oleronia TaxID=38875 RepID=UPI001B1730A3|nr:DUF3599 family protein [Heyndrickxia oleronia]GIN39044.1 hypothetical protein J19TS1_19930 [Heyndrickxia oleronia]